MSKYHTLGPDAQIRGKLLLNMLESKRGAQVRPFLAQHGLANPDPKQWYPLEDIITIFNEISEAGEGAASATYVAIAMREMEVAEWPAEITTLEQALSIINDAYRIQYRGKDIGGFWCEKLGYHHYRILFQLPHPNDYVYGLMYGMARRFLPEDSQFVVQFDNDYPHNDVSGETSAIEVAW